MLLNFGPGSSPSPGLFFDGAPHLLPPTVAMAIDPKRVFSFEVAAIVTIILSVALVLYVLVLFFEG